MSKDKTAIAIALFLMATIAGTLITIPSANAHDPPWNVPTSAYCATSPSTVGVGQYTTIIVWVDRYSPFAGGGLGQRWDGFKIEITKPNGDKQTIGPWKCRSDVGSDFQTFTPEMVGTYTIVFSWPGETAIIPPGLPYSGSSTWNEDNEGDWYEGSTSEPAYLYVQEDPVVGRPETPLPTEFWQRPISAANRGWSPLASNWLKGSWLVNNFQRWGTAPESPHIMWTQPITAARAGGINDAQWPEIPSNVHDYENPWSSPIIMDGKIYYNAPAVADSAQYGYYCIDLYTGEQVWYKNGTDNGLNNPFIMRNLGGGGGGTGAPVPAQVYPGLTQGWLYYYYSVNGQGVLAYLIMVQGSTWYILDAATGNWLLTLVNVPGGTTVTDQDGSILKYSLNTRTGNLLCWNISQSIPPANAFGTGQQQWKMRLGATIDAVNDTSWTEVGPSYGITEDMIRPRSGYTMNVTSDSLKGLPGNINTVLLDDNRVPKQILGFYQERILNAGSSTYSDTFSAWLVNIDEHVAPYSPYPELSATQQNNLGFGVTLAWKKDIQVPLPGKNYTWSIDGQNYDSQTFVLQCKQTMQRWGYSLKDGTLLWGPTPSEGAMNFYGINSDTYYGKILGVGYAGTLYAYDAQTGELLWTYNDTAPAYESPYGDNFPLSIAFVCDEKVYLYSTEHSPTKPLWRPYFICVNITDGTELWKLQNYNMGAAIADGYIITASNFDNNIYCIGKGPSATVVTASPKVSVHGSSVLVEGLVTDVSPGTTKLAQTTRFPNGVPAISEDDQEAWMEYLYEQQTMPENAAGVEVKLETLDPNGNFYEIGTTTSDANGMYSYAFTPEVPGLYTIIATFEGSNSYYGSHAETAINVEEAPQASPTPTPPPASMTDTYVIGFGSAALIAIIIIGVILILLRKR